MRVLWVANEEKSVVEAYRKIHEIYQSFLQQKAKLNWIKGGDDNTKIFHGPIRERKLRNTVYGINDVNGRWVDNGEGVKEACLSYYKGLLGTTRNERVPFCDDVIAKGGVLNED